MARISTVCASLLLLIVVIQADDDHGEDVLQYSTQNFSEEVKKNPHFVMFYAPWCGHCKRLAPTFNQLAQKYNRDLSKETVTIAKVDCTVETSVCSDNGVSGYPTIKFFTGEEEPVKYGGPRSLEAMERFILKNVQGEEAETTEKQDAGGAPGVEIVDGLYILTDKTFSDAISKGHTFIKFYAPWCGHCKSLVPTWEALAKKFQNTDGVNIAKIDCTQHGTICSTHGVRGYPTLIIFKDGEKVEQYQGGRDENSLTDFVKAKSGAQGAEKKEEPVAGGDAADVTDGLYVLTDKTFKNTIARGGTFIMFYAPWCGHCKKLSPTWTTLAKEFKNTDGVNIAKVDCTEYKSICSDYSVRGYPTLMFFKDGEKVEQYQGGRDEKSLMDFVKSKGGAAKASVDETDDDDEEDDNEEEQVDGLTILTVDNFADTIANSHAFVKFYAPWCGHCKSLAPIWDDLAVEYTGHDNVVIGKVDCTEHRELCSEHEVRGYPTLHYFNNGQRLEKYTGGRDKQSLVQFMDKKLLTVTEEERSEQKIADVSPPTPSDDGSVMHISNDLFEETIADGFTFIKYFAPWCGHCKSLAPTWTQLSDVFIKNNNIKIAKVDCTIEEKLCESQNIEGFPTLLLYQNGKLLGEHEGDRDLDTLSKYILDKVPHDEL